jgi:beta-glucosidase
MRRFPDSFLLGCATSAYQIEGGIRNDWTLWEEAGRLKDPSARCGVATDHWNRWQDDFRLLASLGARAYRLSIEWSRIEPRPGEYDDSALARYGEMIAALRDLAIEPFVTLLHFTHPLWFHERCPWHDPRGEAVERFSAFTDHVARALGDRVRFWTVLNEPGAWLSGAYLAGVIPPGKRSLRELGRAFAGLVRAHARAYLVLKEASGGAAQVGIAHNVLRFLPARERSLGDRFVAGYVHEHYNHAFPRALMSGRVRLGSIPGIRFDEPVPEAKGALDFLGVNYYSRVFIRLKPLPRPTVPIEPFYEDRGGLGLSDLGWEIHPTGMTETLLEMSKYGLPIYVTENGLDDRDDTRRAAFLYDHLGAVLDAIERGVDVRGYLHWSLVDNFEWLEAYGPRFGLFSVDYATLDRRPTKAADLYRAIIAERALPAARPEFKVKRGTGRMPVY